MFTKDSFYIFVVIYDTLTPYERHTIWTKFNIRCDDTKVIKKSYRYFSHMSTLSTLYMYMSNEYVMCALELRPVPKCNVSIVNTVCCFSSIRSACFSRRFYFSRRRVFSMFLRQRITMQLKFSIEWWIWLNVNCISYIVVLHQQIHSARNEMICSRTSRIAQLFA